MAIKKKTGYGKAAKGATPKSLSPWMAKKGKK